MRISINLIISFLYGLLALIILTNFNFILFIIKGNFGILSIYIFGLTIISIISILLVQNSNIGMVALMFLLFMGVYVISSIVAVLSFKLLPEDYIIQISNYFKSILILFSFYLYFKYLASTNGLKSFFVFIIVVLLITNSTIFFMDIYDLNLKLSYSGEIIEDKLARASGIWGNANKAASYCLINIIMLLYFTLKPKLSWVKKSIIFICILFLLYCIYLTLSNTFFIITFFIILLYLYFFSIHLETKTKLKIILISFLSILMLTGIFSKDIMKQYENLTPKKKEKITNVLSVFNIGKKKEINFSNRVKLLQVGMLKVKERPIFGNGLGSFQKKLYKEDAIHNFYIQLLGEGGIVTLLSYILFLLFLLKRVLSNNQFEEGSLLSSFFIFLLLFGLTTHGLFLVKGYCIIFALFFVLFESNHNALDTTF